MTRDAPRIAIIGGGIGGCAAAYFAREQFGEQCTVTVFEQSESLGGRINQVTVCGHDIEFGAKWFHDIHHQQLLDFADKFDLTTYNRTDDFQPVGIWTGDEFITLERSFRSLARLVARYGIDPIRLQRQSKGVLTAITDLSKRVDNGQAYDTPMVMLEAVHQDKLLTQTGTEYFRDRGINSTLVNQLVSGVSSGIFSYPPQALHALATLITIAITTTGELRSIRGGNYQICECFVDAADVTVRTGTPVSAIETDGHQITITATENAETFDDVVLAAPIEASGIEITGPDVSLPISRPRYYDPDVAIVEGQIDLNAFAGNSPPNFVVSDREVEPAITALWRIDEGLYELMGPSITVDLLDDIFSFWELHHRHRWQAWPVLTPDVKRLPFQLAPGIYYSNAIESCFSSLALATIGARNVINLIAKYGMESRQR